MLVRGDYFHSLSNTRQNGDQPLVAHPSAARPGKALENQLD